MSLIFETYSKLKKEPTGNIEYTISAPCRIQIKHILTGYCNDNSTQGILNEYLWPEIIKRILNEHALSELNPRTFLSVYYHGPNSNLDQIIEYMNRLNDSDAVVDVIQFCFQGLVRFEPFIIKHGYNRLKYPVKQAVQDLNTRFTEHSIGFKFVNDRILKVDNELLYAQITAPVMSFLGKSDYAQINEEYLMAHKHFRDGNYKDCIVNSAKAYESCLKVICHHRSIPYKQEDVASDLINKLYDSQFLPRYFQDNLGSLRALLSKTVTNVRNKNGAHGQGVLSIEASQSLASVVMDMSGSIIKFLIALLEEK